MATYEWKNAPHKPESCRIVYLKQNGALYPLAYIEFEGLGSSDLMTLLQAAPDLLTACETALPVLMEYHRRHYLDFATDRDVRKAIAQLRDAIDKAKGGE